MTFNVTSVRNDEEIYLAELRLFRLVDDSLVPKRSSNEEAYHRVTVFELLLQDMVESSESIGELPRPQCVQYDRIYTKDIVDWVDGWETLTVTDIARHWIKAAAVNHVSYQLLETYLKDWE